MAQFYAAASSLPTPPTPSPSLALPDPGPSRPLTSQPRTSVSWPGRERAWGPGGGPGRGGPGSLGFSCCLWPHCVTSSVIYPWQGPDPQMLPAPHLPTHRGNQLLRTHTCTHAAGQWLTSSRSGCSVSHPQLGSKQIVFTTDTQHTITWRQDRQEGRAVGPGSPGSQFLKRGSRLERGGEVRGTGWGSESRCEECEAGERQGRNGTTLGVAGQETGIEHAPSLGDHQGLISGICCEVLVPPCPGLPCAPTPCQPQRQLLTTLEPSVSIIAHFLLASNSRLSRCRLRQGSSCRTLSSCGGRVQNHVFIFIRNVLGIKTVMRYTLSSITITKHPGTELRVIGRRGRRGAGGGRTRGRRAGGRRAGCGPRGHTQRPPGGCGTWQHT